MPVGERGGFAELLHRIRAPLRHLAELRLVSHHAGGELAFHLALRDEEHRLRLLLPRLRRGDVDRVAVPQRQRNGNTQPDDTLLLCSDGLNTMVDDKTILDLISRSNGDVEVAARNLIAKANEGGGEDNVTVILMRILEP